MRYSASFSKIATMALSVKLSGTIGTIMQYLTPQQISGRLQWVEEIGYIDSSGMGDATMMSISNRIGQKFGPYELTQFLGRGGFAEVYLGKSVHVPQQVAIKILFKPLVSTKSEQFKKEASIIAQFDHPNIVKLRHYDMYSNLAVTTTLIPYIVMDYAPKGSLRKNYPRSVRLALTTIAAYTKQIAEALQYTHDRQVMHLDIKPENVLIGGQGQLLLSDFGLATILSERDNLTDIEGTLSYMAPEQLNGRPEFASDQYALSIMVYEWICGNVPFTGQTTNEIIDQHFHMRPPSLCAAIPSLLPDVEAVVMKALSKEPRDRYTSVSEFARELERAINQGGANGNGSSNAPNDPFANNPFVASPPPNTPFAVGPILNTPFPFPPGPMPNPTPSFKGSSLPNNQFAGHPFNNPIPGNPDSTTIVNPGPTPIPSYLEKTSGSIGNTTSAPFKSNIIQITKDLIRPKPTVTRRRGRPLLIAGIAANVIAATFIGVWLAQATPSFGNETAWWGFIFSLVVSVGVFFLFFTSGNRMLNSVLSILLAFYWCIVGYVFATLIGAGTRIVVLPDANVMSVLFLLGSFGLHMWMTFKRR